MAEVLDDPGARAADGAPACAVPPTRVGVGLKPTHVPAVLADPPADFFFEVHAENCMGDGGPPHRQLEAIRARFPLSVHGVSLSLGGGDPLDEAHLARLAAVVRRYEPALVSEHLAWTSHAGVHLNDLLPVPYTERWLAHVCARVQRVQESLGRPILLENPSSYLRFAADELAEHEFLAALARHTGCGLLLDVNNAYVSAVNAGREPARALDDFPLEFVAEIHLAGFHAERAADGSRLLVDSHGAAVHAEVLALYAGVIERGGPRPTLVEWDTDVPAWPVLRAEAGRARGTLERALEVAAGARSSDAACSAPANASRSEDARVARSA